MKILAIVRVNLLRAARDRTALFFSVLLPMILILVLGLTYGSGSSARIGLVDADHGPMAAALAAELRRTPAVAVEVRAFDTVDALRDAAARGLVEVGVSIPAGYSTAIAAGEPGHVGVVLARTGAASAVRTTVERAIASQAALVRAARLAGPTDDASFAAAYEAAMARKAGLPGVAVVVTAAGDAAGPGAYDAGAQGQLVLFMFLTSLTGAVELVVTRQLGISRRMFSTPTGMRTIIGGEAAARIAFAFLQGAFIVTASALLFGVRWGDLPAVAAIIVVFAFVAGGAAMLIGTIASNPSQAGAIGPALGLLLGLIGGAMVPREVFPDVMRSLAFLTPHAWAMDALGRAGEQGGSLLRIAPQLAVLTGYAVVLFSLAAWRFQRVLRSGG